MGHINGAYNVQAHGLSMGVRARAWLLVAAALTATFALAAVVVASVPADLAYADDEPAAGSPTTADAGGNTGGADGAAGTGNGSSGGEGGSVADGDVSLTPTDSGGLKPDGTAKDSNSEPAKTITMTIISRSGQALQSFQIEEGKTVSFVDDNGEVLVQYVADTTSVVEPVVPEKSGYNFAGWSVKINDVGNAVITPQYTASPSPSSPTTTDDVKTVRSSNGTVTTNSPKTGDFLPLAGTIAIAGVALLAIVFLLFVRRRS